MSFVPASLDYWKSKFLTSVHGRKLGIDHNGFVVGHPGNRMPYEASTAGTTLANHGLSVLSGSTASWTLNGPPAIGVEKEIINASSLSTATMTILRSSSGSGVTFLANTSGTTELTAVAITLIQRGSGVKLRAVSTSQWAVTSFIGSSLFYAQSTSS